jgi:hypothetical protein
MINHQTNLPISFDKNSRLPSSVNYVRADDGMTSRETWNPCTGQWHPLLASMLVSGISFCTLEMLTTCDKSKRRIPKHEVSEI